jgi:hypothetical protein
MFKGSKKAAISYNYITKGMEKGIEFRATLFAVVCYMSRNLRNGGYDGAGVVDGFCFVDGGRRRSYAGLAEGFGDEKLYGTSDHPKRRGT